MNRPRYSSVTDECFSFLSAGSHFTIHLAPQRRSSFRAIASVLLLGILTLVTEQILPATVGAADGALQPIPEADKPKLLERIRLELTEYQSSIDSIDVKWTRRSLADPAQVPKVMPFARKHWLRLGRRQSVLTEALAALDGPVRVRVFDSYDGEHGYALNYHYSDPSKLNTVNVLDGEPQEFAGVDIAILLGWNLVTLSHESLASLLAKQGGRLAGQRVVHGELCYEVEVGSFIWPGRPDDPHLLLTWIDPQHGWIPRRIQICLELAYRDPVAYATEVHARFAPWECDVKAVQEVIDPLHQRTIFFPREGELADFYAIAVHEVILNPALAASIFRPEIPDGVEVAEHYGTPAFQRTLTGDEPAQAEHERVLEADRDLVGLKQPTPAMLSSPTPIDARPQPSSSLPGIMLGTSVLAFVFAFGFTLADRLRRRNLTRQKGKGIR